MNLERKCEPFLIVFTAKGFLSEFSLDRILGLLTI
jgi:hypothetical protein